MTSICVYCGARPGKNPAYLEAASDLGALLGARGWRLVYGAGDVGVMGEIATAASRSGAATLGIIPTHLKAMEVARSDLTALIETETMHERKKVMALNADGIALLPGGAGSLDEFFEILTWAQLGLHDKPIVIINVAGYWTPLLSLLDHVIDEGFADQSLKDLFTVVATPKEAVAHFDDSLS